MNKYFSHKITTFLITGSIFFLSTCSDKNNPIGVTDKLLTANFAVFSDVHLYDVSLGTTGSAFESYIKSDRKLLAESEAILQSMISLLASEKLDFVLIPGDLTKDGELSGHLKLAAYLKSIEAQGKKVYVIPGNHDINNQHAVKFNGSSTEHVATITPNDFAQIYADFGYGEAIERDPNSLSYVAEPVEGLILIGMDACRYKENGADPITGGKFSPETLEWIKKKIKDAKNSGKLVIGMMHQLVLEHYLNQKSILDEYVVDDFKSVSKQLSEAGMNIIFTGHNHCQDIVLSNSGSNFLYDIETGSLVTYPSPYRIINLSEDNKLYITSKRIESINYNTGGKTFQKYSKDFIQEGVTNITINNMVKLYGMSSLTATILAPYAFDAFIANTEGDESPSTDTKIMIQLLGLNQDQNIRYAASVMNSMWTDLPPKDNNLIIDLTTGSYANPSLLKNGITFNF